MSIHLLPRGRGRLASVTAAFVAGAALTAIVLVGRGPAVAQDGGVGEMDPEMAAMMAEYAAMQAPGDHHAAMAFFVGDWDCEMTFTMGPGGPASTSKAKATYRWLHDGRWMEQRFDGSAMGMPFKGFGLMGYDNFRKRYVSMWVDDMSTSMSLSHGNNAADSSVMTFMGTMDEPMTGEIGKNVISTSTKHSDDHFTFAMHEIHNGERWTPMSIEYRRR